MKRYQNTEGGVVLLPENAAEADMVDRLLNGERLLERDAVQGEYAPEPPHDPEFNTALVLQTEQGSSPLFIGNLEGLQVRQLFSWWMCTAAADFDRTIPKMLEYGGASDQRPGSADLRTIGENIAELLGWPPGETTDAIAQELGAWFYLQGKIARLISDYQHRRPGKSDTWFDANIYVMMARRLQETGQWP